MNEDIHNLLKPENFARSQDLTFILHISKKSLQVFGNEEVKDEASDSVSMKNLINLKKFCLLVVRDAYGLKNLSEFDIRISFGKYLDDNQGFVMLENQEQFTKIVDKKLY